ncbi:MAG: MFS transporter [candidate division NC10 bacterium]|nr:MFS transporter [candidate division NC10 bacterium]
MADGIIERLDRLPLSKFHWRLLWFSGLGWMFDAMDVGIVTFVLASLKESWSLSPQQVGNVASVGLFGMFLGAIFAGALSDRLGRKLAFQGGLFLFSLASGLCGLAWGYRPLLFFRFLVGLGLGGVLPVASTLVSELSPSRYRGRLLTLLESFWAYGWVLAALIAYFVIPRYGWRIAFFLGALPAIYVWVLRRAIPESPRFLLGRGRIQEAEEILTDWVRPSSQEERARKEIHNPLPNAPPPMQRKVGFGELWSPPYLRRTLCLWMLWFFMVYSYYGIFVWLPSLLVASGYTLIRSFRFVLIITLAQIPGYFSAALLVDRIGRKWVLTSYLFLCALAAYLFGRADSVGEILWWGSCMSFFNLGAWGVVYTYTPELYPTRVRGTGSGWAAAFGRLGGILAPLVVGAMLKSWGRGHTEIFGMFALMLILGALVVAILGEETKGKSLEEIAG